MRNCCARPSSAARTSAANLSRFSRARTTAHHELDAVRQSVTLLTGQLAEAVAKRDALKLGLAAVPHFFSVDSAPQVIVSNGRSETLTERRLDEARRNLDTLRLRYTDKHPDVVSQQQLVTQLEQQVDAERKAGTAAGGGEDAGARAARSCDIRKWRTRSTSSSRCDSPTWKALWPRSSAISPTPRPSCTRDDDIAHSVPGIEAKAKDLDRDYDVIKHNYDELLQRREAAKLSEAADTKADKIQFRIVDPPQVPLEPSSPNRKLLISIVLLAGVAAGAVAPFVFTQLDDILHLGRSSAGSWFLRAWRRYQAAVAHTARTHAHQLGAVRHLLFALARRL